MAETSLSVWCLETFWKATGVPLVLVPADPAERFLWLPHPQGERGAATRHQLLWELGCKTRVGAGLAEGAADNSLGACRPLELLAVPVMADRQHVATLLGGPVVLRKPRREEFDIFSRRLDALGIPAGLAVTEAEFLNMPVLSNGRLEAMRGLLGLVAKHIGEQICRVPEGTRADEVDYVSEAKRFIEAHFTEDIGLADVAVALGLSKFHLCKIFHKMTGSTFIAYVVSVRVNHAKKLLAESNLSIQQVARACGFQSHCRFDVVFRKLTGRKPGEYRESIRMEAKRLF